MKPLKPWLAFAQQLEVLQERGLQVEDRAAALDYLERLGYYRLSGYWYPLRAIDPKASQAQGKAVRLDASSPVAVLKTWCACMCSIKNCACSLWTHWSA